MSQPPLPPAAGPPAPIPYQPAPGLNLNYALWSDRVIAAIIDGILNFIVMVLALVVIYAVGFLLAAMGAASTGPNGNENPASDLMAMTGFTICCLGPIILVPTSILLVGLFNKVFLVRKKGSSIGQGIMRLRMVGRDGQIPSVGKLIVRLLCEVFFGLIYILIFLDLLWPLWDPRRQMLHDKAVETYVIKLLPQVSLPPA